MEVADAVPDVDVAEPLVGERPEHPVLVAKIVEPAARVMQDRGVGDDTLGTGRSSGFDLFDRLPDPSIAFRMEAMDPVRDKARTHARRGLAVRIEQEERR